MINPFRHGSARNSTRGAALDSATRNAPKQDGDAARTVQEDVIRVRLPSLLALNHAAESLTLKPGRIRSQSSGTYQSAFKGRGMEFDEVRPYMPGDDARTLDWRVTARTGSPHTKLFREERERAVLLWVDLRSPMLFATRGAFKAVRASQAAALLAWSAVHQGDRLGAFIFNENMHIELRPKRGKAALLRALHGLADDRLWQPGTPGVRPPASQRAEALNGSLSRLRRVAQPGSLIVLLSDFSDFDEAANAHLAQLARNSDLILADIHDPLEAELPPPGRYSVSDGAGQLVMETASRSVREQYQQGFKLKQAAQQQLCRRHGMKLIRLGTAEAPLSALQRGLGGRA